MSSPEMTSGELPTGETATGESGRRASRLPRVAIVGRPNVGKSTLLNRMCGRRVSIVEPTAGVTRDRVAVDARLRTDLGERWLEVVDTGGIGIVDRHDLGRHVEEQVRAAVVSSDLVLFLVDGRDGLTPLDEEVARRLRGIRQPVILVVNKVENERAEWEVEPFRKLGLVEGPFAISAQNGQNLEPLYERIADLLPAPEGDESARRAAPTFKLAIVGRRNAGKSTLVNQLVGEERVIVSEVPGTTRDAIDVILERDGETFVVIDTAGVRKKKSFEDAVDFYSDARSTKAIRRADAVLLLFDATEKLSSLEKRLARFVTDQYKPVVLGANKWDLAVGLRPEDFRSYLDQELPGLHFAPKVFLSAKTGQSVWDAVLLCREMFRQGAQRVPTAEVNRVIERALASRTPGRKGHLVRVRYATQAETSPPTFVVFVNDKRLVGQDTVRFLENRLREELPFEEVPVRILLRDRGHVPTEGTR